MRQVKGTSSLRASVIGDVVGSRRARDRPALHRRVNTALRQVADGAIDPPAFTVGDEFQGSYPTLGAAIDAALTVRLLLVPQIDVRFGIGWGATTVLDANAGIQDGPAWWAARDAITHTAEAQRQPGFTLVRTTFRADDGTRTDVAAVNAALICRDHLLGSLDERSLRIVRGLMTGRTKKELAAAEGISASAVSQRASRDGLDLIVLASQYLRSLP
ncbi:MAG TPA: SatD family protein [Mycobacterium sp.]|nr:SatD family protein [Mycobacterium sp.]